MKQQEVQLRLQLIDFEKMNFRKENFGHSSSENKIGEPAQIVPNPDPSIAGVQSSTSNSKQSVQTLKSPASLQQTVLAIQKAMEEVMEDGIRKSNQQQQHQLVLQQQGQQLLQQQCEIFLNECSIAKNHPMRPQQVLQNHDPSVADIESLTPTSKLLLEILSPASRQQQQVLAICNADPHLMAESAARLIERHRRFMQLLNQQREQLLLQWQAQMFECQKRKQTLFEQNVSGYFTRSC